MKKTRLKLYNFTESKAEAVQVCRNKKKKKKKRVVAILRIEDKQLSSLHHQPKATNEGEVHTSQGEDELASQK